MSKKVLQELEELRKELKHSLGSKQTSSFRKVESPSYDNYRAAISAADAGAERLSYIIGKATDNVDTALRSTTDSLRQSSHLKDFEMKELKTALAAKEKVIDTLRDTLHVTQRNLESKVHEVERTATSHLATIAELQAELSCLKTEKAVLQQKLDAAIQRRKDAEAKAQQKEEELITGLQRKQEAIERSHEAVVETKAKHSKLKSEVQSVGAELTATKQRLEREIGTNRLLQIRMNEHKAIAESQLQTFEPRINQLQQKLKTEKKYRKAAEKWLKAEMRAREHLEDLVMGLREIALGKEKPLPSEVIVKLRDSHLSSDSENKVETGAALRSLHRDNKRVQDEIMELRQSIENRLKSSKKQRSRASSRQRARAKSEPFIQVFY